MKLVLDLIEKYPGNPDLADLRLTAFEKLQPTYLSVAGKRSDRELDKLLNRRVQARGVMVWDLSPRKDGHLWSCIQVQMSERDYRYLQLFFPERGGHLGRSQKEGLVKGCASRYTDSSPRWTSISCRKMNTVSTPSKPGR